MYIRNLLPTFLLILGLATSAHAFSRPTHEWQLFSEVEGQAFHDAVREISWSIDNGQVI